MHTKNPSVILIEIISDLLVPSINACINYFRILPFLGDRVKTILFYLSHDRVEGYDSDGDDDSDSNNVSLVSQSIWREV
jgi:hypothetical protein